MCNDVLFLIFTIVSFPLRVLQLNIQTETTTKKEEEKKILNEVNRLSLKDSTMTFSRDDLKQIAPHKNQHLDMNKSMRRKSI